MKLHQKINEIVAQWWKCSAFWQLLESFQSEPFKDIAMLLIKGYRYAFNKYIANETLNELNLRVNDISQRMEMLIENDFVGTIESELGDTTCTGYPVIARAHPQYIDYFEMFVSDVPSDVCKLMLQSNWDLPYSTFVNVTRYEGDSAICEEADSVTLSYEFHKDLLPEEAIPEDDRHEVQRCNHSNHCKCGSCNQNTGLCESDCANGEYCLKDINDSRWYKCCPESHIGGEYCCSSIAENGNCCNDNSICCPPDAPLLDAKGRCQPCDGLSWYDMTGIGERCTQVCPDRFLLNGKECGLPCDNTLPMLNTDKICYGCDVAKPIPLTHINGDCTTLCPNRKVGGDKNAYCVLKECPDDKPILSGVTGSCTETCPNRHIGGKDNAYCVKEICTTDKPLSDAGGRCYPCDTTVSVPISALSDTCTNLCPERKVGGTNNAYCVLKSCPTDKPILLTTGECMPCDADPLDNVANANNCVRDCPNRVIPQHKHGYNFCTPKCPADKPLMSYHGKCFACDTNDAIDVDNRESTCNQDCPNRIVRPEYWCIQSCSGTTPLMDTSCTCNACDTDKVIPIKTLNGACSTLCPNRVVGGKDNAYCVKSSCPADKPLRLANGTCSACGTTGPVKNLLNPSDCTTYCSGHTIASSASPNTCMPPCPSDKPIQDSAGNCYTCGELSDINIDGLPEGYCTRTCPNRETVDKRCVRLKCENGSFEDAGGHCFPCNISTPIDVAGDESKCTICLNRKVQGNYCVF